MTVGWKKKLRHRYLNVAAFAARDGAARVVSRRPAIRMLLASDLEIVTSEQQFHPFRKHRSKLRKALGLDTLHTDIATARWLLQHLPATFDIIGLKLSFRTPSEDALRIAEAFAAQDAPLIYFDGDDDLSVQWPEVLELCDLYVKKHAFADRAEYLRPTVGKTNLTHYVNENFGHSFEADIIPDNPGLPPHAPDKIRVLANIAQDAPIQELHERVPTLPHVSRSVDVLCRASVKPESWIYPLRNPVIEELRSLEDEHRILLPTERVPKAQYLEEMLSAKLCVSPFGYGEICWRDFEAILCGATLVKPNMNHVETRPNVFVPHETYIPVRWDFSDLVPVCRDYLTRPEECARIAGNAHRVLVEHLQGDPFVRDFADIVSALPRIRAPLANRHGRQ